MADEPYLVHIVDDDAAIRQSVGFMLAKAGYRTKSHASGAEFMKFVNSASPRIARPIINSPPKSADSKVHLS